MLSVRFALLKARKCCIATTPPMRDPFRDAADDPTGQALLLVERSECQFSPTRVETAYH